MNDREEELDAQLDMAERRFAALSDRIMEIADDTLGLQVPGTPPHVMLGALGKAIHDERIAKSTAEMGLVVAMGLLREVERIVATRQPASGLGLVEDVRRLVAWHAELMAGYNKVVAELEMRDAEEDQRCI